MYLQGHWTLKHTPPWLSRFDVGSIIKKKTKKKDRTVNLYLQKFPEEACMGCFSVISVERALFSLLYNSQSYYTSVYLSKK